MQHKSYWLVVLLLIASLQLAACGQSEAAEEENSPAVVEHLESGPDATRIMLTEDAAKRIDIQTAQVSDASGAKGAIPYAAVLYDTEGKTWTYTNPEALTFVRSPITLARVDGETAILQDGPPVGMAVVTVGAAELFGSEAEFEEE